MTDGKEIFCERITCPECKKNIIVKRIKTVTQKAIPAEFNERTIVEKDSQKKLNEVE